MVSSFKGYSAVEVLDRERLDDQYAELLSGYYDENAEAGLDLGHLPPTGYALQIQFRAKPHKLLGRRDRPLDAANRGPGVHPDRADCQRKHRSGDAGPYSVAQGLDSPAHGDRRNHLYPD
ncbi:MAG: hypothetical protein LBQ88_08605 [Treponema sp.]|nr:hypothetical protein [Treponema sp.]